MATEKRTRPFRLGYPDVFLKESGFGHVPSAAVLRVLKPGYFVKLVFESDPPQNGAYHERLWVEITKVAGNNMMFTGVIRQSPAFLKDILPGDHVTFEPRHVCDVSRPNAPAT